MKASARRLALIAAALVAANVSCGREITGPGAARLSGPLSFAAEFPAALRLSGGRQSSVVAFERVRILVRRSSGEIAYDKTIDFPSGADSIALALTVPIAPGAPAEGEPMSLTLRYVNAAGDTVFAGGPVAVLVTPARPGDPPPAAIPVPLRYTGPGEEAVRVVLSPPTATMVANGAPLQFTAQAYDEFDTPLQTSAVVFESSDTTMLTISATGLATARPKRGAVLVIARLFNDGTEGDTSTVTVDLPASSLAFESGDAQTGAAGAPLAQNVVVQALAADAVPVAGVAVTFSAANGGSPTSAVVNTDALGYASVAWTLGPGVGAQTLNATATGLSGSPVTFTATAVGGAPTALAVTTQPNAVVAGEAIAPAVVVEARTAGGQLATGFTGDVTIAIASNPANGVLSGTLTVAAVNGVATFSTLSVDRAAAGYTLVASSAGLTSAVSGSFTVSAASATALNWVVQPVGGTPGVALTPPPAVGAVDAFGNTASFAGTVTIALAANPGSATLSGTASVAAIAGFATFAGISLDNLGVGYTLSATAPGLTAATSDPFTIGAQLIVWTNPAGGSWRNAANWNLGRIPTAADVVEISLAGTYTVLLDTSVTVATLNLGGASGAQTLEMFSRTLSVADFIDVGINGVLRPSNSTINGPGSVQVSGGTLVLSNSMVNAPLANSALVVASGFSQLIGNVGNAPGATLRVAQVDGCCGTAVLTVADGFTNEGLIELSNQITSPYGAQLTVTSGTLVNAAGATISSIGGQTPGGARTLTAQLTNLGLLDVAVPLAITRASAVHVNAGTIDASAADLTITQSGTTPSFTNSGSVTIGAGRTLTVQNGAFNQAAGTLGGPGTLALVNLTAAFTTDFSNATTLLTVSSSTINGPGTLTNAPGRTLALYTTTVNAPLVNDGLLIASGFSTINGTFTNPAGAILRVAQLDGCCGTAQLTVANGFTNEGLIELSNQITSPYAAQLTVTSGTLVNAAGATITSIGGQTPGGARTLTAQLDNQGLLDVAVPLLINRSSSAHVNTGTIDVTLADLTITQSGTTPSFTNSGSVTIGAGRTLTVQNGALNQTAGTLGGPGTLALANLTAAFTTDFSNATTTLLVASSTINGPGTLTNATGRTLSLFSSTINATLVNDGLLIASGNSAANGTFTNPAGATLRVAQLDGCCGNALFTVANGFTNEGLIELSNQITSAYGAQLTVTSGTLVNAAGATITSIGGQTPGGARTLTAQLDNQGLLDVAVPLLMNRASSVHVNTGTIDATAADVTISQSGATPSFTNSGAFTVGAGRTLTVQNGAFNQAAGTLGGAGTLSLVNLSATFTTDFSNATTTLQVASSTINGPGTLTNATGRTLALYSSTVNAPLVNDGLLIASGGSAIGGTFTNPAGATLRVAQLDGCCGTAVLTVANGFTNEGLIELSNQITSAYGAQLTVTNGTLVNAAGATITAIGGQTPGGNRTLAAQLDNQGTLQLSVSLVMNRASSDHVNSGSIAITGGDLSLSQGGTTPSFVNQGAITIGAGRTFAVSGGAFATDVGATIDGGTLSLTSTTATFNDATPTVATLSFGSSTVTLAGPINTATTALNVASSVLSSAQSLTNPSGETLILFSSTLNMPLVNEGLLIANGNSTIGGTFTNAPSATLRVAQVDGCCGSAVLTVTNGFTNEGLIELTNQFVAAYGAQLTVTNGTLLNAAGATIAALGGQTPGGTRTLAAQLDNQGTLSADVSLSLNRVSASHVNSGNITLAGGDLSIAQTGTTPSTVNSGIITIGAGRTLQVAGGSFTNTGIGTISGATFAASNATVAFQGVTPAVASMVLSSSPTSFEQEVSNATTAFTLTSSQLSGTEPFTNAAGQTLTLRSASINMPLDNQGTLIASGTSSVLGSLSTALGSVIRVGQIDGSNGLANLTVANGFANSGTIEITNSFTVGYNSLLTISSGELLNTASGVIISSEGTTGGGTRGITVPGAFTNQGTLTVHPGSAGRLTITSTAGFQNSGTINLELGGLSQGASYDWLALVGGPASLGGTLNIGLINAFTPLSGNSFIPITSVGTISGTFTSVVPPGGVSFNPPTYGTGSVTLVVP